MESKMKRYRLKKDLPTFKKGDKFFISNSGNLCLEEEPYVVAYASTTLQKFPNILTDWFEEIPEKPKTVDDLKEGDECWVVLFGGYGYYTAKIHFDSHAAALREYGSLYLTREDAEKDIAWSKAKTTLERDTKGFKPDWTDEYQTKWNVYYDHHLASLYVDSCHVWNNGSIYFATIEDAKASKETHEKEWKIYLGVEE